MKKISKKEEFKVKFLYKKLFSASEIAEKLKLSLNQVYDSLKRQRIKRRKSAEQNKIRFEKSPLSFKLKKNLTEKEKKLTVAALMLYHGEGAKTGSTVDFANSDPRPIKLFADFLLKVCQINKDRLKLYLYCFENQNVQILIRFWSRLLKVRKQNFTKPYIKKIETVSKRKMLYGVIHVRYSDKRLLNQIIKLYSNLFEELKS